jgi:LCP family protein required for cell wall assembly
MDFGGSAHALYWEPMGLNKQQRSIDGVGSRRRLLSDRQPLTAARRLDQPGDDVHRARRRLNAAEMDADLRSIKQPETRPTARPKVRTKRRRLRRTFAVSGILIVGIIGFLGVRALIALQQITERNLRGGALALQDNIDPTQLKGEGDGRVNILVIGIGGAGHAGGQLADTILVISVDPINNSAAMLSVPRDLYLRVPGYYSMRINEVHAVGENSKQQKDKGGGPALLAENLTRILGVNIHYFVRVDFQGFIQAVDAVGGVDLQVEKAVFDPFIESRFGNGKYGFSIKPGQHHLDGRTALQYGRSRKTSSDFARADRQQDVLVALKNKILSLSTLTNPVKVSSLISAAGNHLRTDLSIDEIMKLLQIAQRIDNSTITNFVLSNAGDNFLSSRNINGAAVMVPRAGLDNFSAIQRYVRSQLFVDGFIKQEQAQIVILNGTSSKGLGSKAAEYLRSYGYSVVEVGTAPQRGQAVTALYDQSGGQKPFTLKLLEKRLNTTAQQPAPAGLTSSADIIIILGDDFTIK